MVAASDFEDTFDNDITTRSSGSDSQNSPGQDPAPAPASIFSLKYYQKFFDVDTDIVTERILSLMIPSRAAGAMEKIAKNPDLYGPFWIVVTTVFAIAVSSNVADFFHQHGINHEWHYNFHLLSIAATIIISYVILVPLGIWAVLQWSPKHEASVLDGEEEGGPDASPAAATSVLALICSYGYSLAIYIPVSLLWTVQISIFQWILMISAATASGLSLLVTLRPSLTKSKYGFGLTVGVVAMHVLLAAALMLYFFHDSSSPSPVSVDTMIPKVQQNATA